MGMRNMLLHAGGKTIFVEEKKLEQIGTENDFLSRTQKFSTFKRKKEQIGLYQTKKLFHSKRNSH
jgi:hypothetical protein